MDNSTFKLAALVVIGCAVLAVGLVGTFSEYIQLEISQMLVIAGGLIALTAAAVSAINLHTEHG